MNERIVRLMAGWVQTRLFYIQFQPDHTGSLLWAIYEHSKYRPVDKYKKMIIKAADGICRLWDKTHFKIPSYNLWEEKVAFPKYEQAHTYTVAMCMLGLKSVSKLVKPRERWLKCIREMKKVLENSYDSKLGYFVRTCGKKKDKTIDSSSLALVWPSEAFDPDDKRIESTVKKIVEANEIKGGIYRYPNDRYDGRIEFGKLTLGGAGAWPILNFWISIYYSMKGEKSKALKYYLWVVRRVNKYIPEQIKNDKPISITPLGWSHAMFIIASKFLRFL